MSDLSNEQIKKEGLQQKTVQYGVVISAVYGTAVFDLMSWFNTQPKGGILPTLSGGAIRGSSIFENSIHDAGPTALLIILSMIPIELGAKILEMTTNKKISDKSKLCLAVLLGMAWPTLGELDLVPFIGTKTPEDLLGVAVAGIVAFGAIELGDFLSKPPPKKLIDRFEDLQKKIKFRL